MNTSKNRSRSFVGILTVVLAACAGGSDPQASSPPDPGAVTVAEQSGSGLVPSHAWRLEGDGEPMSGAEELTFAGGVDLAGGAAAFDGASGYASTTAPGPIDTTASFSVTAWVTLLPPTLDGGTVYATAVSQLGDEAAAFYLGIGEGNWSFAMKDADTNAPGHTVRASATTAESDPDVWVHLVGVHDIETGELRFYLNGEQAAVESFTGAWRAEGPLTIGRAQAHGSAADFWPGAITDVQLFATVLPDDAIGRLAGTPPDAPPPATPATPATAADAGLPNGTYEYAFTDEEKAELEPLFTAAEAAAAGGFDGEVTTSLRFANGRWQQFFAFDGDAFTVDGRLEGDGGTYRVEGDRLVLANPDGEVVYESTADGDSLSLRLLELDDPDERDLVALITEHEYIRVGR